MVLPTHKVENWHITMQQRQISVLKNETNSRTDDFECSEVTNLEDPSHVPLIAPSENSVPGGVIVEDMESDQPQHVLSQFGASIPHDINNVTEAEDVEINEPTITVAQDATDNTRIVAPAPSAIDSDATDAEYIEVDQPVIAPTKANDKRNKPNTTLTSQLFPELNHETDKPAKTPTENTNEAHVQTPSRSPSAIESAANIDNYS
ncbi:hypothetical protein HHI36_016890 [Cryptolaemus montrouzieri]|uniref:Uncharacterized protein n=1 Tax=Cryptolaemus montrouzieri TaxID=559131 RepID=A0ABD2NM14_9CUCU